MNRASLISVTLLFAIACPPALAQVAAKADPAAPPPQVIKLTLHPCAIERPALRFRLLPDLSEQEPGNAAPLYLTACILTGKAPDAPDRPADSERAAELLNTPMDKFPLEESKDLVGRYRNVLRQVELAARREYCRWEPPVRQEGFMTLLPHLNEMRFCAQLLGLDVRINIVQGNFGKAVHTIQTGFVLAHHLNEEAVLVQGLVANAIVHNFAQRIEEFIQAPGAPNLYWPLTNLPDPYLNFRDMLQFERAWLYMSFPQLHPEKRTKLTADDWKSLYTTMMQLSDSPPAKKDAMEKVAQMLSLVSALPQAKEYLVARGMPPNQAEALPMASAIGLYYMASYEEQHDEFYKLCTLPYWQAAEPLRRFENELQQAKPNNRNPLFNFLPALGNVHLRMTVVQRHLAVLRTVEALRAYVAATGKVPASLNELTEMPLPIDPLTGQAFVYSAEGMTAVLHAPTTALAFARGTRNQEANIRYALTFTR